MKFEIVEEAIRDAIEIYDGEKSNKLTKSKIDIPDLTDHIVTHLFEIIM